LYDGSALDAAWDMVKDWTADERQTLRESVPSSGLQTKFRGGTVNDLAKQALEIARAGLNARARLNAHGENETVFLQELDAKVAAGQSSADRLITKFNREWAGDIMRAYTECIY
jgi:glutamate--cysteine ligase